MNRILILILVTALLLNGCKNQSYIQSSGNDDSFDVQAKETETELLDATDDQSNFSYESQRTIFIQVAGAVRNPGVYELFEGSRVYEAIEAAGGLTEEADDRDINQAEKLSDGQKIYIMTEDEARIAILADVSEDTSDGRVNINTATEEQLTTLPGIGASKARLIIAYREANGNFSAVEDILNVSGIGQGIYSQIKDLIKV